MARRLGGDCELTIQDNVSNSEITLKYRVPEPDELIKYRNGQTQRKRNKIIDCSAENRQKWGAKILTGVGDGSFEKKVDGSWVPISSDPKSPNRDPEWKEQVKKQAPDLIETLAVYVFDASSMPIAPEENTEEADPEEDDDIPE